MSIISVIKNRDENYRKYRLSILKKMHNAVLNNGGKSFSFEWSVVTKIIAFQQNDKGRWKEHHRKSVDGDAWTAERIIDELGLAGMYVKSYECIRDDRPNGWSHQKHGIADVCWGYKYTFSVSSVYANKLYKENYGDGKGFYNYLIHNNLELLKSLIGNDFLSPGVACDPIDAFFVTKSSVSYQYHPYIENYPRVATRTFAQIGKTDFKDMHECYGMALAIVNILRETRWNNCALSITYERFFVEESGNKSDGIRVNFSAPKLDSSKSVSDIQLKEW